MPRTILLATDLSCRCDRALDRSAQLAAAWRARLVVLHVLQGPAPVTDLPSWRRPIDARQAARQRVLGDLSGASELDIDVMVESGEPAAVILDQCEKLGCDLVVAGIARDETLGRVMLGTTVETLARKSAVPLLVVKTRARGPYRNVVVATDFSDGSRRALEAVLELFPETRVSLFHAFDLPGEHLVDDRMAARESVARHAMEESQAFIAATPAASGRSITTLCEYGQPGALLEDLVRARAVDLVAIGTEGRRGLARALLGSVAERLLSRVPTDVLVVRARKR